MTRQGQPIYLAVSFYWDHIIASIFSHLSLFHPDLCLFSFSYLFYINHGLKFLSNTYSSTSKPERISCGGNYDVRADVWSLGVMFVELASLRHPYFSENGDYFSTLNAVVTGSCWGWGAFTYLIL